MDMVLPEYLTKDDLGFIHLAGHRIGLSHVVRFYREGYSPEMLSEQFPTLPLAMIHKVIAFYLENVADVDAYCAEDEAEIERQAAAPRQGPRRPELRRRLEAKRRAEAM